MIKTSIGKITLLIALSLAFLNLNVIAQNKGKVRIDTTLKVDSAVIYLDQNSNKITQKEFFNSFMQNLRDSKNRLIQKKNYNAEDKVISFQLIDGKTKITEGMVAPKFIEKDLANNIINLDNYNGKVVVLNFWFINCKPCVAEIPRLNKVVAHFKNDTNVVFLAPTFDNIKDLLVFNTKHNFSYTILPNAQRLIEDYFVDGFPYNIIINKMGVVSNTSFSALKIKSLLIKKINEVRKKQSNYVIIEN